MQGLHNSALTMLNACGLTLRNRTCAEMHARGIDQRVSAECVARSTAEKPRLESIGLGYISTSLSTQPIGSQWNPDFALLRPQFGRYGTRRLGPSSLTLYRRQSTLHCLAGEGLAPSNFPGLGE